MATKKYTMVLIDDKGNSVPFRSYVLEKISKRIEIIEKKIGKRVSTVKIGHNVPNIHCVDITLLDYKIEPTAFEGSVDLIFDKNTFRTV